MYPFPSRFVGARRILAETRALVARMSVAPTPARVSLINRVVRDLKNAGLWSSPKLEGLYVFAAHDAQAARLNWLGSDSASTVNGPTFTADRGYQGNGVDSYLQSGYLTTWPSTDHHYGAFLNAIDTAGGVEITANAVGFMSVSAGVARVKDGTIFTTTISMTGPPRHVAMSRIGSDDFKVYKNGSVAATVIDGPPGWTSGINVQFGQASNSRLSAVHTGRGLSDGEMLALSLAVNGYLVALGASDTYDPTPPDDGSLDFQVDGNPMHTVI
jgi:hypothetical protein